MIECVPNLSEGRDRVRIEEITQAAVAEGCRILDVHCDPDHHRSVLTLIGDEEEIARGSVAVVRAAVTRIDLNLHRGVHPRMGAVDVVPFVPLRGATLAGCVRVAREVGETIGRELRIPVYLYEAAATREDRRNLAWIRKGEFEGFREKILQPAWVPDFGPRRVHPTAGAIAVGARSFLVAFNVVLTSADLSIAQRIAAIVRETGGGLRGVKALGVPLKSRGRVQVSMNLTDIPSTTVPQAFERVRKEAEKAGISVSESEIVGLVPRAAIDGASADDLLLTRDLADLILEERLEAG